jgi:multidrug efflux pump subunit AcrA (membrane-fusion protein)
MNRKLILLLLVAISCQRQGGETGESEAAPRVPVTVASIETGEMADFLDLTATSVFQVKSVVKSPVRGYVEEQYVNAGDAVSKARELFRLRTRESASLHLDTAGSFGFSGLIPVMASLDGMVISIDHPKGDYIQEGDQLAVIAVPSSLVYILDVPYESSRFIKTGASCDVILPDGTKVPGRVKSILPAMNNSSQTQRYVVQPAVVRHDPENLIARVRIARVLAPKAISLPKACILSDEVQQHFWVMKVISDSLAVKVEVKTGLLAAGRVEITDPVFTPDGRFLASGNYGLGDTAKIIIQGIYKNQ